MAAQALQTIRGRERGRTLETNRAGEMLRIRAEDPERKIGGPEGRTETTGDTTGDPGRKIRLEGKEALEEEVEVEDFPAEAEAEGFPVEVGEEDFRVEVEDVVDVEEDLKSEADIRREGKIGDVETVASETFQTGGNVTSAGAPSQMSSNLLHPTPWRKREMRSS